MTTRTNIRSRLMETVVAHDEPEARCQWAIYRSQKSLA